MPKYKQKKKKENYDEEKEKKRKENEGKKFNYTAILSAAEILNINITN